MLIEIAEMDQMPALDFALGRLFVAQQDAQQRRLAAAVGAHDAEPFAALQVEAQPSEEQLVAVGLCRDPRPETPRRPPARTSPKCMRGDSIIVGSFDPFDLVELLAARLGHAWPSARNGRGGCSSSCLSMYSFCASYSLQLLFVAFLAQPHVLLEVAGIGGDAAGRAVSKILVTTLLRK